jgi:hypothetical protein
MLTGNSKVTARVCSTTLLTMVYRVKGGGRGSISPPSPGWADFTIMMECTPGSGHDLTGKESKLFRLSFSYIMTSGLQFAMSVFAFDFPIE